MAEGLITLAPVAAATGTRGYIPMPLRGKAQAQAVARWFRPGESSNG